MIYSGSSSEFSEIRIQAKVPDPGGSGSITLEFLNSVELFGSESAFGMRSVSGSGQGTLRMVETSEQSCRLPKSLAPVFLEIPRQVATADLNMLTF